MCGLEEVVAAYSEHVLDGGQHALAAAAERLFISVGPLIGLVQYALAV